jgi:hypothetical protein
MRDLSHRTRRTAQPGAYGPVPLYELGWLEINRASNIEFYDTPPAVGGARSGSFPAPGPLAWSRNGRTFNQSR